jgi:salicylate hydroxylase
MYNLVLLCPDSLPMGVAKQAGSIDEMKQLFVGWDPMYESYLLVVSFQADIPDQTDIIFEQCQDR